MKKPTVLPEYVEYSAVPTYYLNNIMPLVEDIQELKLSLHLFRLLTKKRGMPRYVSFKQIQSDISILNSIECARQDRVIKLKGILEQIVQRGWLVRVEVGQGEERESIFLLNMVGVDRVIDEINSGRIKIEIDNVIMDASPPAEPLSDVFKYYEENIGMLTPLISDELRLAVGEYPAEWIIDAIRRAVLNNKRNWRYVSRILENWQVEGKSDGAYRQDNTKEDPTKYVRGKYQKFVQH